MNKIHRGLRVLIYYLLLRWLPNDNVPFGFIFDKLRYYCCRPLFKHCGYPVNIRHYAHFGNGSTISLGDHSDLGTNCFIVGDVDIGSQVAISFDVFITSLNRDFSDTEGPTVGEGSRPSAPVTIHDDVLILARVMILPGVTIGSHSVIGGAAVVSKDVPEWAVVAGNPARIVGWRKGAPGPDYDAAAMTPMSEKLQRRLEEKDAGLVR